MLTDVIPCSMTKRPWKELARASTSAALEIEPEAALRQIVHCALRITGDDTAHQKSNALKPGERNFHVSGMFMVSPDETSHFLIAEWGFPPDQHRLHFPLDTGHPGWVWKNRKGLILENTDHHADFKQILKTARMGSAIYAPLTWEGRFLGHLICAAQARNTYIQNDLDRLGCLAAAAASIYIAKGGLAMLDQLWRETTG